KELARFLLTQPIFLMSRIYAAGQSESQKGTISESQKGTRFISFAPWPIGEMVRIRFCLLFFHPVCMVVNAMSLTFRDDTGGLAPFRLHAAGIGKMKRNDASRGL